MVATTSTPSPAARTLAALTWVTDSRKSIQVTGGSIDGSDQASAMLHQIVVIHTKLKKERLTCIALVRASFDPTTCEVVAQPRLQIIHTIHSNYSFEPRIVCCAAYKQHAAHSPRLHIPVPKAVLTIAGLWYLTLAVRSTAGDLGLKHDDS